MPSGNNMTKQVVDIGSIALNGADGDTAREAFTKVNANFTEVYDGLQGQSQSVNNKVDKVAGKSLVDDTEIAKLLTVEANATQNSTDTYLLDRENHTGTQAISSVSGLQAELDTKEEKLVQGVGITIDRTNPDAPVISAAGGAGLGDVVGPSSSIDGEIVVFSGTTGKVIGGGVGVLGTAAFTPSTAYATSAQGAKAETAVQPESLGSAAFTNTDQYATSSQINAVNVLLVDNDATKGSGALPYNPVLNYPVGSLGAAVKASGSGLREDLNSTTDPSKGAGIVGWRGKTVGDILDGLALYELDTNGTVSIDNFLQNALTNNDVVVLPAGDLKLSSTMIMKSGNVLRGQGKTATRIFRDTTVTPFDFFAGVTVDGVIVEGIQFDSVAKLPVTTPSNRHCALRFWDGDTGNRSQNIEVRACKFTKFTAAEIQTEGSRGVIAVDQCNKVKVHECDFVDNRSTCVFYFDSADIQVINNYCLGEQTPYDLVFQPTQGIGSFVSGGGEGHTIALNRIYNTGYSSINVGGNGVVISGNMINSPSYSGIGVNESHITPATNVTISGNTIYNAGLSGIYLWNIQDFNVFGNTIIECGSTGSAGGVRLQNASVGGPVNGMVSNNHIRGTFGSGIRCHAATGVSLQGNRISGSTGSGISFISNPGDGNIDVIVTGNDLVDNTTYAIDTPSPMNTTVKLAVDGNTVVSTNIGTLQATGFVMNGASSTWDIGANTFSSNYTTNSVETSFGNRATKAFLQLNSATINRMKTVSGVNYIGTAVYDPASLADGVGVTATVTVNGASLGDLTRASFSLPLQGVLMTSWVSAPNVISVRFQNESGGVIDLGSGTITAQAVKV